MLQTIKCWLGSSPFGAFFLLDLIDSLHMIRTTGRNSGWLRCTHCQAIKSPFGWMKI